MTAAEISRVDIPTLGARANELLARIGQGVATPQEQAEFSSIHAEFDRRFDTALALAQAREGM